MNALLDTGFLLAVIDADDELHESCVAALRAEVNPILPDVVVPELAYLILRELGYAALTKFLRSIAAGELKIIQTTASDFEPAADVLDKYADSRVDFVDAAIVALAERLNVTRILTVDRRHFGLFKPTHCEFFDILA